MTHDAFLSYNRKDSDQVERIAEVLKDKYKLDIFYDKWSILPGDEFHDVLESALLDSKCCLIFIGECGLGPWQRSEMAAAIDERISNESLVIVPVLLPGFFDERAIPRFLRNYSWVDLRFEKTRENEIKKMINSITRKKADAPIIRKIDLSFISIARKISIIGDAALYLNVSLPIRYVVRRVAIFLAMLFVSLILFYYNYAIVFWPVFIIGFGWCLNAVRQARPELIEIIERYELEKARLIRGYSIYANSIAVNPKHIHSIYDRYCHTCRGNVPFGAIGSVKWYFVYRIIIFIAIFSLIPYGYNAIFGLLNSLLSGVIDFEFIQNIAICGIYVIFISYLKLIRSKTICLCCGTVVWEKESIVSMIFSR